MTTNQLPQPYYEDPKAGIVIYHADCRDILPLLEPGSVNLVLTDPPFSVPVKHEDAKGVYPRSWGNLMVMEPFFQEVLAEIRRVVRLDGQIYIHCDSMSYPVFFKIGYSMWPQSHLLIWYKPTGRRGRGWLHSHELVLHLCTPKTEYADGFRQDVVGITPTRTLNRQHPAEKPGALLTFLMEAMPKQKALIVDPFCGSGTTLRAAKDLGHQAIGIEIEERYCEIAAKRLAQEVIPL